MICKRKITVGERDFVETYSDEHFNLRQIETGRIYGESVIDVIKGHDEKGEPFAYYTYAETEENESGEEFT